MAEEPLGAALSVEGLTVAFPGAAAPALASVDLEVAPGEVVALLGPSGCGKTTLLRVVAGLTTPDSGTVRIDGDDVTDLPAHRRGVGLMFQDYALFPHRDVRGNVEFGLRMAGMRGPERAERVAEVLELVGLAGWEARAVGPLSGGERQRVALARALAPAPRLLLLDEPLGALDRSLRDRLVPELGALFREVGVSVVHVTHDQSEALGIADRVVVMDHGVVVQEGTPVEVWARPASAMVARFLGFANVMPSDGATGAGPGEVLVRPEAVALAPVGVDRGPDGVIQALVFRGDHWVVTVARTGGGELQAVVGTAAGAAWQVGDPVAVTIDPEGIVPL